MRRAPSSSRAPPDDKREPGAPLLCELDFFKIQKGAMRNFTNAPHLKDMPPSPESAGTRNLAYGYAFFGNRPATLKLIAELHEQEKHCYVSPFWFALPAMALGDRG